MEQGKKTMKLNYRITGAIVSIFLLLSIAVADTNQVMSDSDVPAAIADYSKSEELSNVESLKASNWWSVVQKQIIEQEYHITYLPRTTLPDVHEAYHATNRSQNLRTYFTSTGIRLARRTDKHPSWTAGVALTHIGKGDNLRSLPEDRNPQINDARIEFHRDGVVEWYENRSDGLEQGFTLNRMIEGSGFLRLILEIYGDVTPVFSKDRQVIDFFTLSNKKVLRYGKLKVWDSEGRPLASHLELTGNRLDIVVDDKEAVYPIVVDPVFTSYEWSIEGDQTGAQLGLSVATAGDVNKDEYSDVIVGAPFYDIDGNADAGKVFVFYGSETGLTDLTGTYWTARSDWPNAEFGSAVSTAGDVNNDTYDDIIVGAPKYWNGMAFVYHGGSGSKGLDQSGERPTGDLQNADWTAPSSAQDYTDTDFGYAVSTAGDVNGDEIDDVIVGEPGFGNGKVFVYHGSPSPGGLSQSEDWSVEGDQPDSGFGSAVSTAGNVNNDAFSDVIVGAPLYDVYGDADAGKIFVFYGSGTGLSDMNGTYWTAESDWPDGEFGSAVSSAGDVNNDSYDDIIVGAPKYWNGMAFVYHGGTGSKGLDQSGARPTGTLSNADWKAASSLQDPDTPANGTDTEFGYSVSTAGDVNNDGYDDVIVGEPDFTGGNSSVFVYHGSAGGLSQTADWTAASDQPDSKFGSAVSTAGDVDGDGYSDLIIGSPDYNDGELGEGWAFAYYGGPMIDVQGSGVAIENGATSPSVTDDTDFGSTASAGGQVDHTFTIENNGLADLNLTGTPMVGISGAHASDFTVTAQPASQVASGGGTTTFTVRFDPSDTGLRTSTISIDSNEIDESPYSFAIQGMGTNTAPVLGGAVAGQAIDDTATVELFSGFTISDADTAQLQTVTIMLDAAAKGVFTAASLEASGFGTSDGGTTYTLGGVNAGDAQAAIRQLVFDPTDNRVLPGITETTTFTVSVDDGEASPVVDGTTNVVSTSVNDAPAFTSSATPSVAENTTAVITVAATDQDGQTPTFSITGGSDQGLFSINSTTGALFFLSPPDFENKLDADANNIYEVQVTADDGNGGTSTQNITIEITDESPEIEVTGNSQTIVDGDTDPSTDDFTDFGDANAGDVTVTQTYTIENTGTDTLLLTGTDSVSISGDNTDDFSVTVQPEPTLEPGASTTFEVRFAPTAAGLRQATVSIGSDDADEDPYDFAIQGTGLADLGDAPLPYPTTLSENGAWHAATGPTLGIDRDTEADGTHSALADADDADGQVDDETGVTFGIIRVGQLDASVTVNVQNAPSGAKLDAWIDFNADGSWEGPWDRIAVSVDVVNGDNTITFDVPSWAVPGNTYARFRLSTAGGLAPTGGADDGEVEDYQVTLANPSSTDGLFGAENVITTAANGAISPFAADLDNDGDMDVLAALLSDDKIVWYENIGNQNFTSHTITSSADQPRSVFAADMDGDGDLDALSADQGSGEIAWYQNEGTGNFSKYSIEILSGLGASVFAADVDGDGDMDVLAGAYDDSIDNNNKILWYENNGSQSFTPHTIMSGANARAAVRVSAADVDSDGDMDVLAAAFHVDKIYWFENDGSQSFTSRTITSAADGATSVVAADLDGDGDMDVLSSSHYDNKIAWYENDGSEVFTPRTTITTAANGARTVFAADLDGDGDMDVLSASRDDDKVAWYENDGSENFTAHTLTTTADNVSTVFAADMDGDGDLDVLYACGGNDDTIAWYENVPAGFTISESDGSTQVDEAGGTDTFQVVLNTRPNSDVVILITSGDTGEATVNPSTLTFTPSAWDTPQTVTVTGVVDNLVDADQTTTITLEIDDLNSDDDFDPLADQTVSVTTTDNDTATFSISAATVDESAGTATFTVSLDNALDMDVDVDVGYADGTATGISGGAGADYDNDGDQVTFTAGDTADKTVTVAITEDSTVELDETFTASLSTATALGTRSTTLIDTGLGTITDNDTATFTIDDVTVDEGAETATFTVSLDNALDTAVVVDVTYTDGTATGLSTDYDSAAGQVTFAAGDTVDKTVTVAITDDGIVELTEAFTASLSTATALGTRSTDLSDTGLGTITDNDAATFTINDVTVDEGAETATFTVSLDNALDIAVVVDVTYADVTATGLGADYDSAAGQVTFAAGETADKTVTVAITDDSIVELTEAFAASLSTATALGTRSTDLNDTGSGTITDNDAATFTINDVTVDEGAETATFTVSLDNALDTAVVVNVTYADVTATGLGADYYSAAGQVTFAAGDTADKTVTVAITDDSIVELTEAFTASLSTATALGTRSTDLTDTGLGTITDNDTATFTIDDVTVDEGAETATFTVSLDNALDTAVVVDVTYADVTATGLGTDYDSAAGQVTFAAGDTADKTVTVAITDDSIVEADENFTVTLSTATALGVRSVDLTDTGTGTILNDDEYATISGMKWYDQDGDSVKGAEEPGLQGWTVYLDANGNDQLDAEERSITTDADGAYTFDEVQPGSYTVAEVLQPGWVQTYPAGEVNSHDVTAGSGETVPGKNFGNTVQGSIHGIKFEDVDADGVYNSSIDQPLAGVEFRLTGTDGQGNVINQMATTDENGEFGFTNLLPSIAESGPGTGYTVEETVPADYVATTQTEFTNDLVAGSELVAFAGQALLPPDALQTELVVGAPLMFGNTVPGSIHGFKFEDVDGDGVYNPSIDQPMGGISFTLTGIDGQGNVIDQTALTDENGRIAFTGLLPSVADSGPGTGYEVAESVPEGYTATTAISFTTDLMSRQELVAEAGQAEISEGAPQVEVLIGDALMFGNTVQGSIHGFKFEDLDGDGSYDPPIDPPMAGVSFTLTGIDGQGNVIDQTTITDANGKFAFTELLPSVAGSGPGTGYTVTETVPSGYVATTRISEVGIDLLSRQELVAEEGQAQLLEGDPRTEVMRGDALMFGNIAFPTITIDDVALVEGDSGTASFIFAVTRSHNATVASVNFQTADGTALVGVDYTGESGQLNFLAGGAATKQVTIGVLGDQTVEPDKTFFVELSTPVGAVIQGNQGTGTIQNDDSATLTVKDVSQSEDSGNMTFTVTLSAEVQGGLTVDFLTTGITAETEDEDYDRADGTLTFVGTAGETQEFIVTVNADTKIEGDEELTVSLGNVQPQNETVDASDIDAKDDAAGTIVNDDTATLTIAEVSQNEGTGGAKTDFTYTVTLDSDVQGGFDLAYTTDDDTATAASGDYADNDGSLSFAGTAGESQTITVQVNHDANVESDERFQVALGAISGLSGVDSGDISISGSPATGTIVNDDSALLTIADVSQNEGTGDAKTGFTFTVTLDSDVQGGFDLAYTTDDDTATTTDGDYVDNDGSLSFAGTAGETHTITVQVNHDAKAESDELFQVALGGISGLGAGIDPNDVSTAGTPATGTILNDDAATLTLAGVSATQNEGTGGTTTDFTFSVTLNSPVQGGFDLAYTTDDNTATVADGDYADNDGSLSFAGNAGETQTITVQVNHDAKSESDELFQVTLGAISGLGAGIDPDDVSTAGTPATGTILNDDAAALTLAGVSASQNEGTGGTTTGFTFSVTLNNPVQDGFDLAYTTDDNTATVADGDYADNDGSLSFVGTAGETQMITVQVNHDAKAEADELFQVTLGAISGLGAGIDPNDVSTAGTPATGTILNDDTAGITVIPTSGLTTTEGGGTATFTVKLDSEPTADVTIGLTSGDTTEGTVSPVSLTFTSGSWNTAQTVTITGVADTIGDGNVAYSIVTAEAVSSDPNYDGLNAADVSVINFEVIPPPGEYYVNGDSGSDANNGTGSGPWKTLHHTFYLINQGEAGTYTINVDGTFSLEKGESDALLVITHENVNIIGGSTVFLDGADAQSWTTGIVIGASRTTIKGLQLDGFETGIFLGSSTDNGHTVQRYQAGISGEPLLSDIAVEENEITATQIGVGVNVSVNGFRMIKNRLIAEGTDQSFHAISIYGYELGFEISENEILAKDGTALMAFYKIRNDAALSTGLQASDSSVSTIARNHILGSGSSQNQGVGISTWGFTSLIIEGNLIRGFTTGVVVQSSTANVWNNTIVENMTGVRFTNDSNSAKYNVITDNSNAGIEAPSGSLMHYNALWNNGTNYTGGAAAGANDITENPLFENAAGGDFSLKSTSPCLDATDRTDPGVDLEGVDRPQYLSWEMGAYEFKAVDSDGDSLPDYVETGTGTFVDAGDTGTKDDNQDTDGDTVNDGQEVSDSTSPLDKYEFNLPAGSPPRFTSPPPAEETRHGMVNRGFPLNADAYTAEAQSVGRSCTGLTYSLIGAPDGADLKQITEGECDKAELVFAPTVDGTHTIEISVKDETGQSSSENLTFDIVVAKELLVKPKSLVFLRESDGETIQEQSKVFEITGGFSSTSDAGAASYTLEVKRANVDPDDQQPAEIHPVAADGDGLFKWTFGTTGRKDGDYLIIVTDQKGYDFTTELIRINTVVYIPQETKTTTVNDTVTLEVTQEGSEFKGTKIEVPADAAPEGDLTLSMATVDADGGAPFVSSNEIKGPVIALSAKGADDQDVQFSQPVTVTIPLSDILGPDDDKNHIVIIHYNESSGEWEQATSELSADGTSIVVTVSGFSLFAVADPTTFDPPFQITHGTQVGSFRMISFPGTALKKNIRDILETKLGSYDPVYWRLFAFNPKTGQYVEVTDENKELFNGDYRLRPGAAFWLISRNPNSLDVEGLAFNDKDGATFQTVLTSGWNMLSHPWNANVSLASHKIEVSTDGTTWKAINSEENTLTEKSFWKFKGEDGEDGEWYVETQELEKYRSYWIRNLKTVPVFLRMVKNGATAANIPPVPERLRRIALALLNQGISAPVRTGYAASGSQPPNPPQASASASASGNASVLSGGVTASGGGGCFVATAVYGSENHPHVKILRNFRDAYLQTTGVGRRLVLFYYHYGPHAAEYVSDHRALEDLVRAFLLPVVAFASFALWAGLIPTASMIILLGGILFFYRCSFLNRSRFK